MKEVKRWLKPSLKILAYTCLIFTIGCLGRIKTLNDSEVPIPHPTMEGYQCLSPGYLMKIMDEYENCINK